MQREPATTARKRPARRARRTASDRLRDAVLALSGGRGELLTHTERPWASITFSGSRHALGLSFEGEEAVEAGEQLIAALPDHEFAIPGQLVADATIASVEHTLLPSPRLVMQCELLLLVEA